MPSVDEEITDSADEAALQATLYGLIGLLVLLVAVLALVCCYRKKKRQRKAAKTGKEAFFFAAELFLKQCNPYRQGWLMK